MTNLSNDLPSPPDRPTASSPSAERAPMSGTPANQHSDERWERRDVAEAQRDSMQRVRWLTIAAVIVVGTLLWLAFTRWA